MNTLKFKRGIYYPLGTLLDTPHGPAEVVIAKRQGGKVACDRCIFAVDCEFDYKPMKCSRRSRIDKNYVSFKPLGTQASPKDEQVVTSNVIEFKVRK